jgi:hypothetical protein
LSAQVLVVTEADAAAIRAAFEQRGEFEANMSLNEFTPTVISE